jgi:hypothetical protein
VSGVAKTENAEGDCRAGRLKCRLSQNELLRSVAEAHRFWRSQSWRPNVLGINTKKKACSVNGAFCFCPVVSGSFLDIRPIARKLFSAELAAFNTSPAMTTPRRCGQRQPGGNP